MKLNKKNVLKTNPGKDLELIILRYGPSADQTELIRNEKSNKKSD